MTRISTEFFDIEIPELFEKVLQMGPLTRAERMDRAEGERSFAELNLFVGVAADERLGLADDADADAIAATLFARHIEREQDASDDPIAIREESSADGRLRAVLDLPATTWRPPSRQVVEMRGFAASRPPCLSSLILEYDAATEMTYGPVAQTLIEGIAWKPEPFTRAAIDRQAVAVWSIFDGMDPQRRAAIRARHAEIVRPTVSTPQPDFEPPTLDLSTRGDAAPDARLASSCIDAQTFAVHVSLFVDPIGFDLDGFGHTRADDLIAILRVLRGLGESDRAAAGQHAWEHCKICFDATDYGAPERLSNEDHFGIHGPEDAFANLGPGRLYLTETPRDGHAGLFAIQFYPPWEDEHGCALVVRAGRFVGWMENGGHLAEFAEDGN